MKEELRFEKIEQKQKHDREAELKELGPLELMNLKESLLGEYSNIEHDIHYINALLKRQNYGTTEFKGGAF